MHTQGESRGRWNDPANGDAFVEFCKKVGIVTAAAAGTIFLLNMMAGFAWNAATRPIMDAIAAESRARIEADRDLALELGKVSTSIAAMSQDRLDIIEVLAAPVGEPRTEKVREVRARWSTR